MKTIYVGLCAVWMVMLGACAIKPSVVNQYQLTAYDASVQSKSKTHHTITVTQPMAMAGYDTEKMLYIIKPFQLSAFANNSWASAPATMLFPLITESLEKSGYFFAVVSGTGTDVTEYRLETELITLQQNFLIKPSQLELAVQMTLIHVVDNRVVAAKTVHERIPCKLDAPYGGVRAANHATRIVTHKITQFVIAHIEHDTRP